MGIPANPTAAPFEVVPMMTYKKEKEGREDFDHEAGCQTVLAGAEIAKAVGRKAAGNPIRLARSDQVENRSRRNGAYEPGRRCKE